MSEQETESEEVEWSNPNWPPRLRVRRINDTAKLPTRATEGAVGVDLYSNEAIMIPGGEQETIGTDIMVDLPDGHFGLIKSRSGHAANDRLHVEAGVIDPDYRGEIGIVLNNEDDDGYMVDVHERVAQLLVLPFAPVQVVDIEQELIEEGVIVEDGEVMPDTERGAGGFGSTGKVDDEEGGVDE